MALLERRNGVGDQLLESWDIYNRVNLFLLDTIEPEHLAVVSASRGRSVGEQFAHLHNGRLMWLKQAGPELIGLLRKVEKEAAINRPLLQRSLVDSGQGRDPRQEHRIRREGKRFQTPRGRVPRVSHFTRVAPSGADSDIAQAGRPLAQEKVLVRCLGVGREVAGRAPCAI